MKKFTLLLIFAALISCSNDDNDVSSKNNLKGKWNWILTSGGFGGPQTPEMTKEKKVNQFSGNTLKTYINGTLSQTQILEKKVIQFSGNTLKTYINGTLFQTQKFSIQTKPSPLGGNRKVIVIDKGNSITNEVYINQSFEIIGKKLYLRDECVDCATSEYERIK